jgi:DHA2 family multidrug resistance protein
MEMFEDRNFVSGLVLMFVIGAVLLASSALLPPYLQNLAGLSVFDTGLLMAPRGFGTMFAMMFAGRMALRFDPRVLMTIGCSMLLWSMWDMSTWTPQISDEWLTVVTFIQGVGMGLVFVPMNLTAFATLPGHLRTDGTAMTNLMRNIGSAIGVSVTTALLGGGIQTAHALLAGHASSFNRALTVNAPAMFMNPQLPFGLQNLDGQIMYRAQVFAYQNDFLFMFYASLPALLVIWMMRRPVFTPGAPKPEMEVME